MTTIQHIRERVEGMRERKPKGKCINAETHLFGTCFNCRYIDGKNDMIDQILSLLNELEKEITQKAENGLIDPKSL